MSSEDGLPPPQVRQELAQFLNQCGPADNARSREVYAYKPTIEIPPTREELASWLQWNDPNGCYTDSAIKSETMSWDCDRCEDGGSEDEPVCLQCEGSGKVIDDWEPTPIGALWAHVWDLWEEEHGTESHDHIGDWCAKFG